MEQVAELGPHLGVVIDEMLHPKLSLAAYPGLEGAAAPSKVIKSHAHVHAPQ